MLSLCPHVADARNVHRQVKMKKNPAYTRLFPPTTGWSTKEDEALTGFVLLSTAGFAWPSTKSTQLWEGAAAFIKNMVGTKRTSKLIVADNY